MVQEPAQNPANMSRHPEQVQIELWLDLPPDPTGAIAAGRRWFELAVDRLGHELRDQFRRAVETDAYVGLDQRRRVAGGISARVGWEYTLNGKTNTRNSDYSPASWRRLLDVVGRLPGSAGLEIKTWAAHPRGEPSMLFPGHPKFAVSWTRFDDMPEWCMLEINGTESLMVGSADRDSAIESFIHEVADGCDPVSGEVSYHDPIGVTRLEDALHLRTDDTLPKAREVIRGYSWLTVIAEEIGNRLGGAEALHASGAFHDVQHLRRGGYLLQATERFHDYQLPQAEKVFEVLAPALPPGQPRDPIIYAPHLQSPPPDMLVRRDPRDISG